MDDLDGMTIGMVLDIFTEEGNDGYKYPYEATQEDIDQFIEG